MFLKFRVIDGEYMYIVKISKSIVSHIYKVKLFRFVKVRHKINLIKPIKR